jgi:hypothetical protein
MNTLNSVSKNSGAKHNFEETGIQSTSLGLTIGKDLRQIVSLNQQ